MPLVHRLTVTVPNDDAELAANVLFELGAAGLEESAAGAQTRLTTCLDDDTALAELLVACQLAFEQLEVTAELTAASVEEDWTTAMFAGLRPEPLGDSFWLAPLGQGPELPGTRQTLYYQPALAFGDGSHPTTQLAALVLERACRANPGVSVLDVGTGNGVLAAIARLSGAGLVTALDVDPVAVAAATELFALNAIHGVTLLEGDAAQLTGKYQLVVANVEATVLLPAAAPISAAVAAGGKLVLTGLLTEQREEVLASYESEGLRLHADAADSPWELLVLERGGDAE